MQAQLRYKLANGQDLALAVAVQRQHATFVARHQYLRRSVGFLEPGRYVSLVVQHAPNIHVV